jgi:hypothetical protein
MLKAQQCSGEPGKEQSFTGFEAESRLGKIDFAELFGDS